MFTIVYCSVYYVVLVSYQLELTVSCHDGSVQGSNSNLLISYTHSFNWSKEIVWNSNKSKWNEFEFHWIWILKLSLFLCLFHFFGANRKYTVGKSEFQCIHLTNGTHPTLALTQTRAHTIKSVKQTDRLTLPSKRRYIHINTHELCEKTRLQCSIQSNICRFHLFLQSNKKNRFTFESAEKSHRINPFRHWIGLQLNCISFSYRKNIIFG